MLAKAKLDNMYRMRQSGTTLDELGARFGITREGVRQLLNGHFGSTRVQNLLTVTELARRAGCSYRHIAKLKRHGVIRPKMVVGHGRTLWKPETIAAVTGYINRHECPVCHAPLPTHRSVYCSRKCYLEACRHHNKRRQAAKSHKN